MISVGGVLLITCQMRLKQSDVPCLCVRHLVPLTDLKPVNPVPAYFATPARKGDLGGFRLPQPLTSRMDSLSSFVQIWILAVTGTAIATSGSHVAAVG